MTLHEIIVAAQDGLIGLVVVLLGLIRLPKIDLNLWSLLARAIGRSMNKEVVEKVNKIGSELDAHIKKTEEVRIKQARQRILRFSDDIMLGKIQSQEHYNDILDDIDLYEDYCDEHPGFINNKAEIAIDVVRKTYQEHLNHHSFLTYKERN